MGDRLLAPAIATSPLCACAGRFVPLRVTTSVLVNDVDAHVDEALVILRAHS